MLAEQLVPIDLKLCKQNWKVETQNLCIICRSNPDLSIVYFTSPCIQG